GVQSPGGLAVGKKFSRHRGTRPGSHADLPVGGHPRAPPHPAEFVPLNAPIAAHHAGLMSPPPSFSTIRAAPGPPRPLATKVLTDLLRHDLHFDGLVTTDSLEMGALGKSGFPAPRAAAQALKAGADLLLFNSGYALHQAAIAQIVDEVRAGTIPLARLDD